MPDYKTMYFKLFNACSKAIEMLQTAEQMTEKMAMDATEPIVFVEASLKEREEPEQ